MLTVTHLASTGVSLLNSNVLNNNLNLNTTNQNGNTSSSVAASANIIQHHLNVLSAQQQQQQQQQQHQQQQQDQEQKAYIHTALTRAVSHPQNSAANVVSLVNTLLENCHRKLERTQSEPLPQVNTSRYKTELCRPFEEAGECKYGEKCQFAHGYHELRNLQRHPKYKTEYCRTFHSVGFCPYGPRCHFVHNADEARAMIQQQQQQQQQQQHHQQQIQHQNRINAAFARQNALNNHPLPLSPPLSMSTGSDRASPTGSISLSPTNSMGSFPFVDQISPASSVFQTTAFSYNHSPPASPNSPMSPVNTPPPSIIMTGNNNNNNNHQYIKPISQTRISNKSSSPISIVANGGNSSANSTTSGNNTSSAASSEEARLPVFNRLSSTLDAFSNLAL
ncbi:protein TIS11 isoform X2 [Episyrphus balteatus]|nr:protein TIS11 isoform X2 [Episyrphus balteatus]